MDSSARPERAGNTRINLEQARKQAKELVKAFESGDARALDRIRWNHPRFLRLSDAEIKSRDFALADAQLVIARLHHIESWPKLLQYVHSIENVDPAITRFEIAADAIIEGNVELLRSMLREHPELIRQRSTRSHHSTLLHYVSANGVENYRQVTPPNILEVTQLLLDAGAEVDATSDAYGGGSTTLGLAATSAHPRLAGVQLALLDLLIDNGAETGEVRPGAGRACVANGCPEAALHFIQRGAKPDDFFGAAALGLVDVVSRLFASSDSKLRESALLVAAQSDRTEVVQFLLERGVNVAAYDGMTALHWASANANLPMMEVLLSHGAPLEAHNEYGGTVLSSTIWFAYHARPADFAARNYPATFDRLIAAGGRTDFYPEMLREIEGVRERAKRVSNSSTTPAS